MEPIRLTGKQVVFIYISLYVTCRGGISNEEMRKNMEFTNR